MFLNWIFASPLGRIRILSRTLTSRVAGQCAHIVHQVPNVLRSLDLTEGRHSREPNPILKDPKQLSIGIALHLLAGKISRAWVHPLPQRRLTTTIGAMTYAALQAEMGTSIVQTCFCVDRARRNSTMACAVNKETLSSIDDVRFNMTGFWQGGQVETHQHNHNQHHCKR